MALDAAIANFFAGKATNQSHHQLGEQQLGPLMAGTESAALAAGPGIVSGPAATAARAPSPRRRLRKRIELTVLLGPPLVLFIGFVIVPIIFAAWYSLLQLERIRPADRLRRRCRTTRACCPGRSSIRHCCTT